LCRRAAQGAICPIGGRLSPEKDTWMVPLWLGVGGT
jgi:hypothetical protein